MSTLHQRRFFYVIVPAIWAACSFAVSSTQASELSPRVRALLLKAHTCMRQEQFHAAEKLLRTYVAKRPDTAPAVLYLALGNTLYLQEKIAEALQTYRKGLNIEPGNYSLCLNCAVASYEIGNYAEAGSFFEKACALKKTAAARNTRSHSDTHDGCRKLLRQAAVAYYQAENFESARRVLQGLLKQDTETEPELLKLLVHIYIALQNMVQAQETLQQYLYTRPDNPDYWKLLAHLRLEREQYRQAAAALAIAIALSPQPDPRDAENLAEIYFYTGAPLQAARTLESFYDNATAADVYRRISQAYARALRYEQAIAFLDKADEISADEDSCLSKARLLHTDGRSEEALTLLTTCGSTNNSGRLHLLRGRIAWETARWEIARSELTQAAREPKLRDQALSYLTVLKSLDAARRDPPPGFRGDTDS